MRKRIEELILYKKLNIKKRYSKKNTKLTIFLLSFFSIFLLFFLIDYVFTPRIILTKKVVTINYLEKYKEPGYKAYYLNKNITNKVKVSGVVNSKKIGRYRLTYTVKTKIFKTTATRIIYVRDLTAPTINLIGGTTAYVCPDKTYKELGYSANDNYDKKITNKVRMKVLKDKVEYEVVDKAGNLRTTTRKIIYKDKEAPVINLNGGSYLSIFLGDTFTDPLYSVVDNCDKDLNKKVKITGSVDTNKLGDYKLVYETEDSSGNKTKVERIVSVVNHDAVGTIYLTFDDGPRQGTTDKILDILKEENVKATFFVTGYGPDFLIRREFEEGHAIGLHTFSHNYSYIYASRDNYFADLDNISNRVFNITGLRSKIIRFPGGASNTVSRKYKPGIMSEISTEVLLKGYKFYDWNLSSTDAAGSNTKRQIYNAVVSRLSHDKVNMILMHDVKTCTRDALRDIIVYAKNNGYVFDKITLDTKMISQHINN